MSATLAPPTGICYTDTALPCGEALRRGGRSSRVEHQTVALGVGGSRPLGRPLLRRLWDQATETAMRSTAIGNLSTLKCMEAFVAAGYAVSLPYGDGSPYDLVIDDGATLQRVECKTARLARDGAITVWMRSNNGRWSKTSTWPPYRLYAGRADLLAAYCPETDKVYLITSEHLSKCVLRLRVSPTANKQHKGIRWAQDFEMSALEH
jgi:hypothetical protein